MAQLPKGCAGTADSVLDFFSFPKEVLAQYIWYQLSSSFVAFWNGKCSTTLMVHPETLISAGLPGVVVKSQALVGPSKEVQANPKLIH